MWVNIQTNINVVGSTTLRDMIMSMITMKYTQSNSVGYVFNGQMIGIGARGQISERLALFASIAEFPKSRT